MCFARDVQHAAVGVHLGQPQPAGLRHAQAMPEHQKQQASVAGCVTAIFRGVHELLNLGGNQVFAVVHRFVQCLGVVRGRKPASLLENVFQH